MMSSKWLSFLDILSLSLRVCRLSVPSATGCAQLQNVDDHALKKGRGLQRRRADSSQSDRERDGGERGGHL